MIATVAAANAAYGTDPTALALRAALTLATCVAAGNGDTAPAPAAPSRLAPPAISSLRPANVRNAVTLTLWRYAVTAVTVALPFFVR